MARSRQSSLLLLYRIVCLVSEIDATFFTEKRNREKLEYNDSIPSVTS